MTSRNAGAVELSRASCVSRRPCHSSRYAVGAWSALFALAAAAGCDEQRAEARDDSGDSGAQDTAPGEDASGELPDDDAASDTPVRDEIDAANPDGMALDTFVDTVCTAQAEWWCATRSACACPDADDAGCATAAYGRCAQRITQQLGDDPGAWVADADETARCATAMALDAIDCGESGNERLAAACAGALSLRARQGESCAVDGAPCDAGRGVCSTAMCRELPGAGDRCGDGATGTLCSAGLACIGGSCTPMPVAPGGTCELSGQCEAGARCLGGLCVVGSSAREACDAGRPCVGATSCVEGACVPATPSSCTAPGEIGPCGVEGICGAERAMTCGAPVPSGGSCSETSQCATGTWCDPATGTCVDSPVEGESCGDGVWCAAGLACGFASGQCAPVPAAGEPCALGLYGPFVCAEGLACVGGRCGPLPGEGDECGGGAVCGAGLGCSFEGDISRCRPRRAAGEPCDNDTICTDGTHCDFATARCREHFGIGTPCSQGNECGPTGSCVPQDGGRFACVALPEEGDACLFECASGLRCVVSTGPLACYASVCATGG